MKEPTCACFEYVGDNPYCPVHGKAEGTIPQGTDAPRGPDAPKAPGLVVRTSRAGTKVIATLEPTSAAHATEASDAGSMPARIVVEDE